MASNTAWTRLDATATPLLYSPIERAALLRPGDPEFHEQER
jgi:hypothetical protein